MFDVLIYLHSDKLHIAWGMCNQVTAVFPNNLFPSLSYKSAVHFICLYFLKDVFEGEVGYGAFVRILLKSLLATRFCLAQRQRRMVRLVAFYPTETQFYFNSVQLLLEIGSRKRLLLHSDAQQHLTSVTPAVMQWEALSLWCLACKKLSSPSNHWSSYSVCCSKHSC